MGIWLLQVGGISTGEWFLGTIGFVGVISSVVVAARLQSSQNERDALWQAISEVRHSVSNNGAEIAELRGQLRGIARYRN